jgi:hypothetical protein
VDVVAGTGVAVIGVVGVVTVPSSRFVDAAVMRDVASLAERLFEPFITTRDMRHMCPACIQKKKNQRVSRALKEKREDVRLPTYCIACMHAAGPAYIHTYQPAAYLHLPNGLTQQHSHNNTAAR